MVIQSKIVIVGRCTVLDEMAKALNGTLGIM